MRGFPAQFPKVLCKGLPTGFTLVLLLAAAVAVQAQDNQQALSQKLANPISDQISVPVQLNVLFDVGEDNGTLSVLTVQPVIPFHLSDNWNLIARPVVPFILTRDIFDSDIGGIGDTQAQLFFSPVDPGPGGLIWGVGPLINLPTATDSRLGSGSWGAGPNAVALVQEGPWTVGVLANHLWTFEDNGQDQSLLQPWATYEFGKGQSVTLQSQSSYDWNTREWTIPLTFTYQQVVTIGEQALQWQIGGNYLVSAPEGAPGWGIQTGITFIFPTH